MALGRGSRAPRDALRQRDLRGGFRKVTCEVPAIQRLDNLILDPILVIEHDYDLKTRCYA